MAKRFMFGVLCLLFLPLLVLANLTVSESEIELGDDSSVAGTTKESEEIDVTNTGPNNLTNVAIEFTVVSEYSSLDFDVTALGLNDNLEVGEIDNNVKIRVKIPEEGFDAVNEDLKKEEFEIGTASFTGDEVDGNGTVTGNSITGDPVTIKLEMENSLLIDKVELQIKDSGDSKTAISDGNTFAVTEDDDVEFTITVKNKLDQSKFEDIEIRILLDDDEKEDTTIDEIEEDSTKEEEVEVNVPSETGTIDITIELEGKDEAGGLHGEKFDFKFDVDEEAVQTSSFNADDQDGDGVADLDDQCPNTPSSCSADPIGCPYDDDNDGLCNDIDTTPQGDPDDDQDDQEDNQEQQSVPQQAVSNTAELEEDTKADKDDDGSSSFVPFMIGFFVGVVIAAGFFMLLRS